MTGSICSDNDDPVSVTGLQAAPTAPLSPSRGRIANVSSAQSLTMMITTQSAALCRQELLTTRTRPVALAPSRRGRARVTTA
jgi:hypothetical protein